MEQSNLYDYPLCVSLSLMLFFAGYFIFGALPKKESYRTYKISRAVMGIALLVLSANYMVHLFVQLRFVLRELAICMNLCTYFLEAWLFSSALTALLDKEYLTLRRFMKHIGLWAIYTVAGSVVLLVIKPGLLRYLWLAFMAVWFLVYAFNLARRLYLTYKRAQRSFDNYHSGDIGLYVRWMSRFTYWAVVFGVLVGLLTFLPDRYIFLWIISAIPFYIYLFCSYLNYQMFCEQMDEILEAEKTLEEDEEEELASDDDSPAYYDEIEKKLDKWIAGKGYTEEGLTVATLAGELGTNRTYLYEYFKRNQNVPFRIWINQYRMEYAKQLLMENHELTASDVAKRAGYVSLSYFTHTFSEAEGITPARWRKQQDAKGTSHDAQ